MVLLLSNAKSLSVAFTSLVNKSIRAFSPDRPFHVKLSTKERSPTSPAPKSINSVFSPVASGRGAIFFFLATIRQVRTRALSNQQAFTSLAMASTSKVFSKRY